MQRHRMPRQIEVPAPFRDTDYLEAARLPRLFIDDDLVVEYSLSAPEFFGDLDVSPDEVLDKLRRQKCTAWVFENGKSVGGVLLKRYIIPPWMENEDFLYYMDMDSSAEYELSCALASQFANVGEELATYGDVLELNRLWMKRSPSLVGRSPKIVKALVSAFCPEFAVIVLKAFPLEYEAALSTVDEEVRLEPALKRRQVAMMNYYRREFGVAPMSSAYGEGGWMLRARSGLEEIMGL